MEQQIEMALRQSAHRVIFALANFLPGIAAFLLALIVLTACGFLLAWIARRILTAVHFDERIASRSHVTALGIGDWIASRSPTRLVSQTIVWLSLLAGIAVGVSALDASYSNNSQVGLFILPYVTHFVGSALLLFAGTILARFLSRSVLIAAVNAQLQYARFLALGVKWLMLVLAGAMAIDHLGIGGAIVELAFGILFGGIVLTLSLAIGLGSRDLVSRSIEKNLDRPARGPEPAASTRPADQTSNVRHF